MLLEARAAGRPVGGHDPHQIRLIASRKLAAYLDAKDVAAHRVHAIGVADDLHLAERLCHDVFLEGVRVRGADDRPPTADPVGTCHGPTRQSELKLAQASGRSREKPVASS